MSYDFHQTMLKTIIFLFAIRKSFSKPECAENAADFPAIFKNKNARIVNGFDTEEPLPYQLMMKVKVGKHQKHIF